MNKREKFVNDILETCKMMALNELTDKEQNKLYSFIDERILNRGKLGYQFKAVLFYRLRFFGKNQLPEIACYVLACNYLKAGKTIDGNVIIDRDHFKKYDGYEHKYIIENYIRYKDFDTVIATFNTIDETLQYMEEKELFDDAYYYYIDNDGMACIVEY